MQPILYDNYSTHDMTSNKRVKGKDKDKCVIPRHSPKLGTNQGDANTMMNYSFGGDGESLITSDFQGKGSPSTKDDLVSTILKLAAELMHLNLVSYSQF